MIMYWEKYSSLISSIVNYKVNNCMTISDTGKWIGKEFVAGRRYLMIGSGFDIETSKIVTPEFKSAYCYHWQFSLDELTIGGRSLKSYDDFLEMLLLTIKQTGNYLLCLDANLGYEFQFLKRHWHRFGMSQLFAKEKRNPLRLDIGECIEMREVIGLFGTSLEQIAKGYCETQKMVGDINYDDVILSTTQMTQKEIRYCENDVQILSELGQHIFRNFFGSNPSLPMTSTGIIRAKVKKKLGSSLKWEKDRIQGNLPTERLYNIFRQYLFKGGICGSNASLANLVLDNVVCADYTSDYPACMNHRLYPDGKIEEIETIEFMRFSNIPYIAVITFYKLQSRTCHSFLSCSKALDFQYDASKCTVDNGRIFDADKITFIVNDVEFRAIAKAYKWEDLRIRQAWKFERYRRLPRHLLDVLNEAYLEKEKLKSEGKSKSIEYKEQKAIVNGNFGMCCTAIFTEILEFEGCEIEPRKDENDNIVKKPFDEAIKSMFLSPFWGFWITSYARSLLMDVITRFPNCIVQYDTDSIYYLKDHRDAPALEKFIVDYNNYIFKKNDGIFNGNPHFRDLGAWDVAEPYRRFKGLGAKRYMYEYFDKNEQKWKIETVVAGCRKGSIEKQFNDDVASGKFKGDIFQFFNDQMTIDEEHSRKLGSTYVDDYDGLPEIIVDYKDRDGNTESILLESATVLEPIQFKLGLNPQYNAFFNTLQRLYKNSPAGSEVCQLYETIIGYNGDLKNVVKKTNIMEQEGWLDETD